MTVDNRTILNAAENSGDAWLGDDAVADVSTAGSFYQGGQALSSQYSNSLERMTCSTIGGIRDLSNATTWILVKDNLVQTKASGGFQMTLTDGTDEVGFYCNGYDSPPLALPKFFNSVRLDVSNRAALGSNAYTGSAGALTATVITGVGYGSQHLAKAAGSVDNIIIDASSFILNTEYAFTIDGGTAGTPITFATVAIDDEANGWGCWANLQGNKVDVNASFEFAPSVANDDSYFVDTNFQLFLDARDVGAGNFIVRSRGGTGTNVLNLSTGTIVNLGTPVNFDFSDSTVNGFNFDSLSWNNCGTFIFPLSKPVTKQTFNGCGAITQNGSNLDGLKIANSTATYGLIVDNELTIGKVIVDGDVDLTALTATNITLTDFTCTGGIVNNASNVVINQGAGSSIGLTADWTNVNPAGDVTVVLPQQFLNVSGLIAGVSKITIRDGSFILPGGQEDPALNTTFSMSFETQLPGNKVELNITTPGFETIDEEITLSDKDIFKDYTLEPDPSFSP